MDQNNSSGASPNAAIDRDLTDVDCKTSKTLGNDLDNLSIHNNFCDSQNHGLLNEAGKIFQAGVEKDFVIWEKNKIIQDAMETMENMKTNIYRIQMKYEKLDQNYKKEVSNTAEVFKRMDCTRNMIEEAVHYANILANSLKQLEDDKFKIVEFYNELYTRLSEEEEKRKKIEIVTKQLEDFIEKGASRLIREKEEVEEKLSALINNLYQIENQLKYETQKKADSEVELEKCKLEMKDLQSNLILEQTNKMNHQILLSQLKKKTLQQKAEYEKNLILQRISFKRKVKLLKTKVTNLRERLYASEESITNYQNTIRDLEKKVIDFNDIFQKLSENHEKEVKELEEKLKISFTENSKLDDVIRAVKQEQIEGNLKIKALNEENLILTNAKDSTYLKLQEVENRMEKLLQENSNLEQKVKELLSEFNSKTEIINNLMVEIESRNTEELEEKIKTYEEKLLKCDAIEKELRNEIILLSETMRKESSENEEMRLKNRARIQQLEKEVTILQGEKESAEKKVKKNNSAFNLMKNELNVKSADLERITEELQSKMSMASNEAELSEEYKRKFEKEKKLNEDLIQLVHKLEGEKAALDRDFVQVLDREKLLNKTLSREMKEKEGTIRKLESDVEQGKELVKNREEKLNRQENELLEMKKLSEKIKSNEETINNLKKSLESSEANAEAYKIVIQKLEGECARRKNLENETMKKLQLEINQLKQLNEKNEIVDTPKSQYSPPHEKEDRPKSSKKTPTSSRKLLSTPNRLLDNPYLGQNVKSISPKLKNRDPYDYDSEWTAELDHVQTPYQSSAKKSIFTSKRKK